MKILIVMLAFIATRGAATQDYQLTTVTAGLRSPWCVAFLPQGGYLITEQRGALKKISADGTSVQTIEGVPSVHHASQGGLFDVLLAPDFATSGVLYLSYAEGPPDSNATALSRARLEDDRLVDFQVLHRVTPRKDTPVHYGGRLAWLGDGTLLLTTGDGFDFREAAQDKGSELGKLLRLTAAGEPAPGNPFPDAPYVYSYGHRNPQGLAVGADGTVYLHEHGPRGGDELNLIVPGTNYGWPAISYGVDYNGALVTPYTEWEGMAQPVHFWVPSIAPSGLAVYDARLFAQWRGDVFVGALVDKEVRRLTLRDGKAVAETPLFAELGARIRDVRVGPQGALYLLTNEKDAKLVRVTPQ